METISTITIGWDKGDKFAEVDAFPGRVKNRIQKLHEKYPEEFGDYYENEDGSIYAEVPVKWIKIQKPRAGRVIELTEEQKQANADRLRRYAEEKRQRKSIIN